MKSLLEQTLIFIAEFREQFSEMPCATEFLRDYSEDLKCGLAQWEKLAPDDQRRFLDMAKEVLGLIAAEWDKCEAVFGNHLRLAMVERLQKDIREAIRGLEKQPISA